MARGNRSDYIILGSLVGMTAVIIALMVFSGQLERKGADSPPVHTTYGTNDSGLLAWFLLLERFDFEPRRTHRLLHAETLQDVGVVLAIDPPVRYLPPERRDLAHWVRNGGVLLCAGRAARALHELHGIGLARQGTRYGTDEYGEDDEYEDAHDSPYRVEASARPVAAATAVPAHAAALPLAAGVEAVAFPGPRVLEIDTAFENTGSPPDAGEIEPLFVDAHGVRIAARRIGRGWVIVLAEPDAFANAHIGQSDNAVLATNLAAHAAHLAPHRTLAYDEYHFGYGGQETGFTLLLKLLVASPAGWGVLVVTAAGGLWLYLRGRRFGARYPDLLTRKRSKLEYVYSVGATYRSAGANGLALWLLVRRFRRRLAMIGGRGEAEAPERLAASVTADVELRGRLRALLESVDSVRPRTRLSAGDFRAHLKSMAELEREILHGTSRRE